jgi:hypothetical protein
MKHHTRLVASLALGAFATALSASAQSTNAKPIVITPPAVKDGSNFSRAPFPSARTFDDTKAPDAQAIDQVGPNSPAGNIEPPRPAAAVAVAQPAAAPAPVAVAVAPAPAAAPTVVTVANPSLQPTGRMTTAVATSLDSTTFVPTVRSADLTTRDQVLADIQTRVTNSEKALGSYHSSMSQMSADGRRQFTAAEDAAKEKAKALKRSIKAAKKADNASWDTARAQLAADYEAYASAVAQIDAAAGVR